MKNCWYPMEKYS